MPGARSRGRAGRQAERRLPRAAPQRRETDAFACEERTPRACTPATRDERRSKAGACAVYFFWPFQLPVWMPSRALNEPLKFAQSWVKSHVNVPFALGVVP